MGGVKKTRDEKQETEDVSLSRFASQKLPVGLSLVSALIYYFSNPTPQNYYDYTFRVAENFVRGSIGFVEKRPSWLNEFVPFEGAWYSVFQIGRASCRERV